MACVVRISIVLVLWYFLATMPNLSYSREDLLSIGASCGHCPVALDVYHKLQQYDICSVKPTRRGRRAFVKDQRRIPVLAPSRTNHEMNHGMHEKPIDSLRNPRDILTVPHDLSDCDMNPCENGWCEETMTGYRCHCPIGFQGKQCHELDTNPPATTPGIVVSCVKDITVTVELGTPNKSVEFISPSAVDREGTVVLVSHQNYKSGDDFPVGSTLVEYIFADESGNQASFCTFNVNVNTVDTTPPEVQSCPSNQTFSVLKTTTPITWTPPTASDASGIACIVANYEPGVNVSVNSTISVIYTVTDNSGLVNTNCSFNITLVSVETEWECTSSKCYRVVARWRNWQDAHDFCLTLGPITTAAGDRTPSLLFADTEDATSQLALILKKSYCLKWVWINCNDMETEGLFMCDVDGKGAAVQINSTNWASGEPNGGNENCVALNGQYKWYNISCHYIRCAICQIVL